MLSQEALKKIDHELTKYPPERRQAAVMAALQIAQEEKGWLSNETISEVAQYLGIPDIAALEVASFYTMYETTTDGKFTLKEGECMGTCGGAPLFHINNTRMCEFLTPEKVDEILEDLK